MTPDRWQRIESLFHDVIQYDPGERAAFLKAHTGDDDALRKEVESLLASFDQAPDFLESSPLEGATAGEPRRAAGRSIGHYQVLSLLGSGGMGDVYLARDARLDRNIALKLLPALFTEDRSPVLRFEREARAASALNHPNIITVYEIGREGEEHFIATEFIEGQTLRQKIIAGNIKLREAISVAVQIATALQAAHEAGIVHRDIKPENIMVRPDGLIKVLDFGLAKPEESEPVNVGMACGTGLQTDHGALMGTVTYLSPEQARGEKVDHRADIFSLGVVVYEMIAGVRPFRGETASEIIDAILNHPPAPVGEAPPAFQRIVDRALKKEPANRYQTAGELRDDLQQLARELDSKAEQSRSSALNGKTVTAAILLVGLVVWFASSRSGDSTSAAASPWSSAHSVLLTDDASAEMFPSLAPDGGSFVYASRAAGNWDIYSQRVDERVGSRKPLNLTGSFAGEDTQPAFSPDGKWIAFRSNRDGGGIFLMSASGGSLRRLTDIGFHPSWSPNGEEVLCTDENIIKPDNRTVRPRRLWAVNVSTGERRTITTEDVAQPRWSPGGHRIAYWGMRQNGQRDIWTMSANGEAIVQVTDDEALDWNPVWSPDGRHLYFASNRSGGMKLWRVPIDEESGRVQGEPELIPTPSAYSQHISFSRDGKLLAYAQVIEQTNVQKIGFDAPRGRVTGTPSYITQGSQVISGIDISHNGDWLVCDSVGEERESIFLLRSDGKGGRHQVTTDEYKYRNPCFSPDGKRIAFYSNRSGYWEAWSIDIDGSNLRQLTHTLERGAFFPIWSPDGKRIAYTTRDGAPFVIETTKAWSEQTPIPAFLPTEPGETFWPRAWSADGKSLIGMLRTGESPPPSMLGSHSLETRRLERFTGFMGGGNIQVGDEHRLLFRSGGSIVMGDRRTGSARALISPEPNQIVNFALSSDKRTIYFTLKEIRADIWMLAIN